MLIITLSQVKNNCQVIVPEDIAKWRHHLKRTSMDERQNLGRYFYRLYNYFKNNTLTICEKEKEEKSELLVVLVVACVTLIIIATKLLYKIVQNGRTRGTTEGPTDVFNRHDFRAPDESRITTDEYASVADATGRINRIEGIHTWR